MAFEPKSAYAKKLLDPRWQKKRLEILQRDNFTCKYCAATDKTLHVHHKHYIYGQDPWDYREDWLITLCAECHEIETETMREAIADLTQELKLTFTGEMLCELVPVINGLRRFYGQIDMASIIAYHIETPENFERLRNAYYTELKARKGGGE